MKIIEESQGSATKKFLFSRFFAELYYFFALHLYAVLVITGLALSIAALLFVAELLFPKAVHVFNYSMTDKVFTELVADHKCHAAIAFMDSKKDLVESSDEPYKFRTPLADCYVHTGDYPKALEQYRLLREWFDKKFAEEPPEELDPEQIRQCRDFIDFCYLKEEFRIHLKMGDIANVRRFSARMKQLHDATDWDRFEEFLSEESGMMLAELLGGLKLVDGFRLELIQGRYLSDPDGALDEMEKYTVEVARSRKHNPVYKLHLFNELLRMLVEQGRRIAARHYLEQALHIVDSLEYNKVIFGEMGNLSDHCFALNDAADGRRLLRKYLMHIDDTYDRSDIEYAVAHAKEFKCLEADGDWERLTRRVVDASAALRAQIANNFMGMTSAQREFFIGQFRPLFDYANGLMERHPSDDLAVACFENNMFLRGLLLRSATSVANAIAAMGSEELAAKYDRYVEASRELVTRQYVTGLGNYYARKRLEGEIAALESEIAAASLDFRRESEASELSAAGLRKSLGENDVAMMIAEGDRTVFALLMDRSGRVAYRQIASKERLAELTGSFGAIYVDADAVNELLGAVLPDVTGKDVYLTTSGPFNQLALGALPVNDSGNTLSDLSRIHVVGSPADIPAVKSADAIALKGKSSVLWGGVDYGSADSLTAGVALTRGLLRGDDLGRLPNSLAEVEQVAGMLRGNECKAAVVSGKDATEKSFTSRSRKGDYILHISTHGFFHDSGTFTNPMQNSGLLFANSQRSWASESPMASINDADGILRADEIAGLDLSGCRLVVLSACQTGLGEYNSEGVYGLQRAFKLAGAQSVLMSLWSVDDSATSELMTEFYRGLIAGLTPDDALVAAQRSLRSRGYSPSKWAAFVLLN